MNVHETMSAKGVKPSALRMQIYNYLDGHRTHPTVDEIYTELSAEYPTLSKTTVYNTLKLFVEHGAAQMLTIDEHNVCFDGDLSLHAHFLCKSCNKIFDLPAPKEDELITKMQNEGFQVEATHYYYRGICPSCKEQAN